jgi:DNA (cytosine-5)-methyltransferase 1
VDCVVAGFPCQPVSRAGRRDGESHEQWLWPQLLRVIKECEPGIVFIENVETLRARHGGGIVCHLAACGLAVAWDLFSARGVGAYHTRPRLFILAAKRHCLDDAMRRRRWVEEVEVRPRRQTSFPPSPRVLSGDAGLRGVWPEPGLSGCLDGSPNRVDRLRAAGNGVVPEVAARAWRVLSRRLSEVA